LGLGERRSLPVIVRGRLIVRVEEEEFEALHEWAA